LDLAHEQQNKILLFALALALCCAAVEIGFGNISDQSSLASERKKENVTLTVLFNEFNKKDMGKSLVDSAINNLRVNHPDLNIQLKYLETTYTDSRDQFLKAMSNSTPIDIISIDQIWLGEFAEKGLLTDLTNYTEKWGRSSDWYRANWGGGIYNDKVYGIWAWTDVRGIWYWKDLLNETAVNPDSLKTWDGYIDAEKKLNKVLEPKGIEGVHLTGASHSPDLWYPYLWMLGGEILEMKEGHPTKGSYWFPAYNSTEGVRALGFIKDQVDAGIKPQKQHYFGKEFADRKFAVMTEGSWMPSWMSSNLPKKESQDVGFIPAFPVPDRGIKTSSLMGGWELGIPITSKYKALAWDLVVSILDPVTLSPWLAKQGYLPTQIPIGDGPYSNDLRKVIPYYDDMISLIPLSGSRPSIPEYPLIATDIRQALDDVYYGLKEPKQALDDAAKRSAKHLGW
jgi:multiple sugar transport system substrate-binding protein